MLRPWELVVDIVRDSGTAIHVQIAQKIIADIQSGRFTPGVALPGTRDLASKIQVNRKTVIQAYDELISQGWLTSESKRGTFVSSRTLTISHSNHSNHSNKLAQMTQHSSTQHHPYYPLHKDIRSIQSKRKAQDVIHFSEGLPDARLIPFEMLSRAMRHALIASARNNKSSNGDPKGTIILREAILQMLNMERALHTKIENICIVRGRQMAIFLIAKVTVNAGDFVALETLTNPLARETFINCGANILNVAHDENGLDVDHLASLCAQHKIRAVYVTPHHQIPTTVTMSYHRRLQLLALAEQYDFLIIEDDCYHEFSFTQQNILPIASVARHKRVIYLGSLSNVLSPNFCIGYVIAPTEIIDLCARQVSLIDHQGDQVTELAIAELLHIGEIKKHVLRTFLIYEERHHLICSLLREELSEFVSFRLPDSGLAIWLEVHPSINIITLAKDAELEKVHFIAGEQFSFNNQPILGIRLGFANLNAEEMRIGIKRLKTAFLNQQQKLLRA